LFVPCVKFRTVATAQPAKVVGDGKEVVDGGNVLGSLGERGQIEVTALETLFLLDYVFLI